MELHVNQGQSGYIFYAPMLITDAEWTALKRLNQQIDGRIVECYRDPIKSMWRPKLDDGVPRFRDDKTDGNHISVVESVLGSIEDAVTEQDLIGAAQSIRNAFKERQKAREEEQKRAQEAEKRRREEEKKRRESQAPPVMKSETPPEDDDDGPKYDD